MVKRKTGFSYKKFLRNVGKLSVSKTEKVLKSSEPRKPRSKQAAIRKGIRKVMGDYTTIRKSRKTAQGTQGSGPGRPRSTYKIRMHPITGKPTSIPATEYYKLVKKARNLRRLQAEAKDNLEIKKLAKKGIPPAQARQIVDQRQLRKEGFYKQQQQVQSMPTQQMNNGDAEDYEIQQEVREIPQEGYYRQVPYQLKYKIVTDIMTGRRRLVPIPQQERWQR